MHLELIKVHLSVTKGLESQLPLKDSTSYGTFLAVFGDWLHKIWEGREGRKGKGKRGEETERHKERLWFVTQTYLWDKDTNMSCPGLRHYPQAITTYPVLRGNPPHASELWWSTIYFLSPYGDVKKYFFNQTEPHHGCKCLDYSDIWKAKWKAFLPFWITVIMSVMMAVMKSPSPALICFPWSISKTWKCSPLTKPSRVTISHSNTLPKCILLLFISQMRMGSYALRTIVIPTPLNEQTKSTTSIKKSRNLILLFRLCLHESLKLF